MICDDCIDWQYFKNGCCNNLSSEIIDGICDSFSFYEEFDYIGYFDFKGWAV